MSVTVSSIEQEPASALQAAFTLLKANEPDPIADKHHYPYRIHISANKDLTSFLARVNDSQSGQYATPEKALTAALANHLNDMTPKPFGAPRRRPKLSLAQRGAIARHNNK